ncbi:MAG: hypothetical protein J7J65_03735 [Candidatus Korarchaeota archaeon]|nr:hypothetical protein [Candidatus Korarchaeota archaeon]
MTSRYREEPPSPEIIQLAHLYHDLVKGSPISPRDITGSRSDSILWLPNEGVSLTEAVLLAGKPVVPLQTVQMKLERQLGIKAGYLMDLLKAGLISLISDTPSQDPLIPYYLKRVVLFSLAWFITNSALASGLTALEEIVSFYLLKMREYVREWGEKAREAFSLMALGMEPLLREMLHKGVKSELSTLVNLILYPVALAATMKAFLSPQLDKSLLWPLISPKMVVHTDKLHGYLPMVIRDNEELLRFAQDMHETYREIGLRLILTLRRLSLGRMPVDLGSLQELLDQVSSDLMDWSRRRRVRFLGAKVKRKEIRVYAFYPSAPDIWLSRLREWGLQRMSSGPSPTTAYPWPFKEKGVAFLSLSFGIQN